MNSSDVLGNVTAFLTCLLFQRSRKEHTAGYHLLYFCDEIMSKKLYFIKDQLNRQIRNGSEKSSRPLKGKISILHLTDSSNLNS